MKKMLALALCVLLLAGCTAPVVETTTPPEPEYIGNSPVPNLRTGIMAQGTTALCNGVEVTNQGVYFFAEMDMGQYLMYVDHDGTEAVKLCSRPDCAHDSNTCNAFFPSAEGMAVELKKFVPEVYINRNLASDRMFQLSEEAFTLPFLPLVKPEARCRWLIRTN